MRSAGAEARQPLEDLSSEPLGSGSTDLLSDYRRVREASVRLTAPLSPEDRLAQSMPDASPTKWHLAHTAWFFETFLLQPAGEGSYHPDFGFLFNSYYEALGARHPRPQRGLITRPTCEQVSLYRTHVDRAMERLISSGGAQGSARALVELGLAHEEQHQELILTDILHLFAQNSTLPAYRPAAPRGVASRGARPLAFETFQGGLVQVGFDGEGFAFDNEGPAHQVFLRPYRLADRLVTNGEWLAFMADDGYTRPEFWLSEGWGHVQAQRWEAPLYWFRTEPGDPGVEGWRAFSLDGLQTLDLDAPVHHVSLYEAAAYANWAGARLPTEAEWECAAADVPTAGNFVESGELRPVAAGAEPGLRQMFGDVWEWTSSAYAPYPGFRAGPGAVGEYNGKFMINQTVLRGGSCVTPGRHIRATYRNFFQPHQRWQFSGLRLAQDAD